MLTNNSLSLFMKGQAHSDANNSFFCYKTVLSQYCWMTRLEKNSRSTSWLYLTVMYIPTSHTHTKVLHSDSMLVFPQMHCGYQYYLILRRVAAQKLVQPDGILGFWHRAVCQASLYLLYKIILQESLRWDICTRKSRM